MKDIHQVDICTLYSLDTSTERGNTGNYLYNDENGCRIHQSYASINQVEFFCSALGDAPDLPINLYQTTDDTRFNSTTISGNSLRAPPTKA